MPLAGLNRGADGADTCPDRFPSTPGDPARQNQPARTMPSSNPTSRNSGPGDTSPGARLLTEWFRQLDRCLRVARTFGSGAPNSRSARERALEDLMGIVAGHAPFVLQCTPLELWLRDEAVVRPPASSSLEAQGSMERRIPFLLYRDGVRALTFTPHTTREDVGALLDSLLRVTTSQSTDEDLVTLLWEANLEGLRVDVAPLEQLLRMPSAPDAAAGAPHGVAAAALAEDPEVSGGEHESGRESAPSLPRVNQEDWPVAAEAPDPLAAWRELAAGEAASREEFLAEWARERSRPWTQDVPELIRTVTALDPGPETAAALAHSLVTWLAGAIQRCEWGEGVHALLALQELDPDGKHSAEALGAVLQGIDAEPIAERLDESEPEAQAQFFALSVGLGRPALDLLVGVVAVATRARLRAAATTALSYLCSDEPRLLARFLEDKRWYVVRNVVFVLGQIGGPEVVSMLANTAHHPDMRVRRSMVHALGQSPVPLRLPLLLELLDSTDVQTVSATLAMLGRGSDPRVTAALLDCISATDFESRPDEVKVALVGALGEAAAAVVVPVLDQLLQKGGWFARRTAERTAAAQALARVGTPAAMAILQAGLQSRSEAIRVSCQDALARKGRAA